MPVINIVEMVSDLKEYLPPEGNTLSDRNLTAISENIVANSVPEDDDGHTDASQLTYGDCWRELQGSGAVGGCDYVKVSVV